MVTSSHCSSVSGKNKKPQFLVFISAPPPLSTMRTSFSMATHPLAGNTQLCIYPLRPLGWFWLSHSQCGCAGEVNFLAWIGKAWKLLPCLPGTSRDSQEDLCLRGMPGKPNSDTLLESSVPILPSFHSKISRCEWGAAGARALLRAKPT